jgi:hypothetical protein
MFIRSFLQFEVSQPQSGPVTPDEQPPESSQLVMAWNEHTNPTRTDLAIALSDDDGTTWPNAFVFDTHNAVSYPDIDYLNGDLVVVYDQSRARYGTIWLARISEKQLAAGHNSANQYKISQDAQ